MLPAQNPSPPAFPPAALATAAADTCPPTPALTYPPTRRALSKYCAADTRIGGDSTVVLKTTYLDDRVRLGRGSRGSLFVFTRGGQADLVGGFPRGAGMKGGGECV